MAASASASVFGISEVGPEASSLRTNRNTIPSVLRAASYFSQLATSAWLAHAVSNVRPSAPRTRCLLFLLRHLLLRLLRSSLLGRPARWLARSLRHWFKRRGLTAERRASARWQTGHRMNFGRGMRTDWIMRVVMSRVDEPASLVARHARWRQQKVSF